MTALTPFVLRRERLLYMTETILQIEFWKTTELQYMKCPAQNCQEAEVVQGV